MPPVFGPVSSSPIRLKSCAGSSGTTERPSVMQNSDTSGPSRYSSTTTLPQLAACASAAAPVVGDDDTLAGGQAVVLDDVGRAELVERGRGLVGGHAGRAPARSARRRRP